jgi:hypothetical protein
MDKKEENTTAQIKGSKSGTKPMAMTSWDSSEIPTMDFFSRKRTMNGQCYSE